MNVLFRKKWPRPKAYNAAEDILSRLCASFQGMAQGDVGNDTELHTEIVRWLENEMFSVEDLHLKRLLKDRDEHDTPREDE